MSTLNHDLPDAGQGMCCYGAAVHGAAGCTCWVAVYDQEQAPVQYGAPAQRTKRCADCAFASGSPERTGDEKMQHSGEGELQELVYSRNSFACHIGMRRIVEWRHPSGVVVAAYPGSYAPPDRSAGRCSEWAAKADGTPADACAGLMQERRRLRDVEDGQ